MSVLITSARIEGSDLPEHWLLVYTKYGCKESVRLKFRYKVSSLARYVNIGV